MMHGIARKYTCELNNACVYQLHNLVRRLGACKIHNMSWVGLLSVPRRWFSVIDSLVICAVIVWGGWVLNSACELVSSVMQLVYQSPK